MSASAAQAARPLPERRVVAVFDLDGTLTRRDSLFPFLRFLVGDLAFALRLPLVLPLLAAMALGLVSRQRAKELVLGLFLRGVPRGVLASRGEAFARSRMPALLRASALRRLAWHQQSRHHCVLLSASPALYVEAWGRLAGFDDVLATNLEYDARDCATGRIDGANCAGEEKLRRLQERFGDLSFLTLHGYGDSPEDKAFLERCAEASFRPFRGEAAAAPRADEAGRRNRAADFLKLMRPHQWMKNGFVFVGVIFGHAWKVPEMLLGALLAAAAFSLVASAIYIVNDYADRERDRVHPKKRHRPLAAGRVMPAAALGLATLLAAAGAAIGAAAGPAVLALLAIYAAMNLAYSFALKGVVILDVFLIAAGFILRILAGTLGIGIAPSQWLIVCSLFLTLFLGFTKRRSELLVVSSEYIVHRKALLHYNPALLDKLMGICAGAALMSYSLYTMSEQTARLHGTENLIYTIPFVAYGMFRYLYLLHAKQVGGDTSHELVRDPHLVATVLGWAAVTVLLIA
jgi:HAD superfamily hydrolase (TIGR01490 family)